MNILITILISICAGAAIAFQSSLSGQLSSIIKSPLWASMVIYFTGFLFLGGYIFLSNTKMPSIALIKSVPVHLWYVGPLLSACALTIVYWQMPTIGVAKVMTGVLTGQIVISVIASHFGWFGLPVLTLNLLRACGVLFMFSGVILINWR